MKISNLLRREYKPGDTYAPRGALGMLDFDYKLAQTHFSVISLNNVSFDMEEFKVRPLHETHQLSLKAY